MGLHQKQIALESIKDQDWSGKKALDIGCSDGRLSLEIMLKTNANELVGVDTALDRIAKANTLVKSKELKNAVFFLSKAENLTRFEDNSFDIIFCNMAFQQFKDKQKALDEIYRVLKDDCEAIINFNTEKSPVWYQQEIIYNELFGDPKMTVSREKTFKSNEFKPMAEKSGFKDININIEDNIYYYQNIDQVIDKTDESFFAKEKNLTYKQNEKLNIELKKYLNSIKTEEGIQESWKILFARLKK
jgi:ubiquinone/menaquinone biosynthesis C-methylase UbiE